MNYIHSEWFRVFGKYQNGEHILRGLIQKIDYEKRPYHNLIHLEEMTRVIEAMFLIAGKSRDKKFYDNLIFACLYHDAIYDTTQNNNEEASALMANDELRHMNVPLQDVVYVVELIMSTKKHEPVRTLRFDDYYGKLFLDADLSILAATPYRYQQYMEAIRKEYSWVEKEQYREGRAAILKKFLERPRIFLTDMIETNCEDRARKNIKMELAFLELQKL